MDAQATAKQAMEEAYKLRPLIKAGLIPYHEGTGKLQALFDQVTPYMQALAVKHGIKPKPLNVKAFLR